MSDTWRLNAIVQAIDIISQNIVSQAGFDKTIKGKVIKVIDRALGTYLIRYQDSTFEADATNAKITYEVGQDVFILISNNDWDRRKIILGGVESYATTYQQIPIADDQYNTIGISGTTIDKVIELCSYKGNQSITLYPSEEGETKYLSVNDISKYIKQGNGLAFRMKVRTDFLDSQIGGKYGLKFTLTFKDTTTTDANATVDRDFILDSSQVIGNPYMLTLPQWVTTLFQDIDVENFKEIKYIEAFAQGFNEDPNIKINDIFISDIQINGAHALTEKELNGYTLHIDCSKNGDTLSKIKQGEEESEKSTLLKAQLKVNGKEITSDVEYYWFRLNGMVLRGNNKYYSRAGDGWECLNPYPTTENSNGTTVQTSSTPNAYTTNEVTFYTGIEDDNQKRKFSAKDRVNKILCVAVYRGHATNGLITIINLNIVELKITSSDKINDNEYQTIYYLDRGTPTFTCEGIEEKITAGLITLNNDKEKIVYNWKVLHANGTFLEKKDIVKDSNLDYTKALKKFNDYENLLKKYSVQSRKDWLANETNQKSYNDAKVAWNKIKTELRIVGNTYYNFPIKSITSSAKVICTVTKLIKQDSGNPIQNYIGTASITLYNRNQIEGMYSLVLLNGTQVFQYDGKGNSPTSSQILKPIEIPSLTFALFDNNNKLITHELIKANGLIKWIIPNKQTLLSSKLGEGETGATDLTVSRAVLPLPADSYTVYKSLDTFSYSIADRYDAKLNINYIWLHVKYKDLNFDAYTNFTFPKDGDPGTNGTDIIAKIVSSNGVTDRIYISDQDPKRMFDDNGAIISQLDFKLYNNSLLFSPSSEATLSWSCPPIVGTDSTHNKGKVRTYLSKSDNNRWRVPQIYQSLLGKSSQNIRDEKPVNIIRAQYKEDKINYFAECPICTEFLINKDYRLKVKPKTGFQYVVYALDGTRPLYDNTLPFEIIVEKLYDNNYWGIDETSRTYTWYVIGNLIIESSSGNSAIIKPKDSFDGDDLSSAILVNVSKVGRIHIPIYMIINRYGHSAINDWDGNSIDLGEDSGMILAPQVGAGSKNDNHQFNGVLMGVVKTPANGNNEEKILTGLFGYNNGQRSIFLNSDNGSAVFGKQGSGQIKLEPNKKIAGRDSALIYSGNYPINDFEDSTKGKYNVVITGNLSNNKEKDNKGLMIDLSTPQIGFGSGNFTVNQKGEMVARGGGEIAGWTIRNTKLFKDILPHKKEDNTIQKGSSTGMASEGNPVFWAYETSLDDDGKTVVEDKNFYVNRSGYLFSKKGQIAGWTISENSLYNTKIENGENIYTVGMNVDPEKDDGKVFYAGKNKDVFYVKHDGYLRSTSGKIATWDIEEDYLKNNYVGMGERSFTDLIVQNSTTKKWLHTNPFLIETAENKKDLTALGITARFWAGKNGDTIKNLNFVVDDQGLLFSKAGLIGGWHIQSNKLWAVGSAQKGNGIQINANGTIQSNYNTTTGSGSIIQGDTTIPYDYSTGTGYSINYDGTATFNKIYANGGKIGNWNISGGQLSNGSVTLTAGGTLIANSGSLGGVNIDSGGIHGTGFDITPSSAKFTGLQVGSDNKVTTTTGTGGTGTGISNNGNGFKLTGSGGSVGNNSFDKDYLTLEKCKDATGQILKWNNINYVDGASIKGDKGWKMEDVEFLKKGDNTNYQVNFNNLKATVVIPGSAFTDSTGKACSGSTTATITFDTGFSAYVSLPTFSDASKKVCTGLGNFVFSRSKAVLWGAEVNFAKITDSTSTYAQDNN